MKSEQNLNAVKQNFESYKVFLRVLNAKLKRVKVAKVDLLAHMSSGELSGPWASCYCYVL